MKRFDLKEVKRNANGKWKHILSTNGIGEGFLRNINGPCPFCGGKDRWRWENKDGDGSGFCHQCDARGDGFKILGKWLNLSDRKDFSKLLQIVAESTGGSCLSEISTTTAYLASKNEILEIAQTIWSETLRIDEDSPAGSYLKSRGLRVPAEISDIKWHPKLRYYHDGKFIGYFPGIVSKVSDGSSKLIGIHRIFLNEDGEKLALGPCKKLLGSTQTGSIQFDQPNEVLHIAEGVETSLAVREFVAAPTWSAISATNMRTIFVPKHVSKVVIWSDLDTNLIGQFAAADLARRLHEEGKTVFIKVPKPISEEETKADWLDVYNFRMKRGSYAF